MLFDVPVITKRLLGGCLLLGVSAFSSLGWGAVTVSASSQTARVLFTEVNENGETLNREVGNLSMQGLQLSYRRAGGWYWQASTLMGGNTVSYTGLSQAGPSRLFATETEYFFNQLQAKVGRAFEHSTFYVGLGHKYRERNILRRESIRGLYEEFEHNYVLAGLDYRFAHGERSLIRLDMQVQSSFSSNLLVETDGLYDPAVGSTGNDLTFSASVEWFAESQSGWSIGIAPMYEYTNVSRGGEFPLMQNGVEVGSFHQPESQWETFSLRLRVGKRF